MKISSVKRLAKRAIAYGLSALMITSWVWESGSGTLVVAAEEATEVVTEEVVEEDAEVEETTEPEVVEEVEEDNSDAETEIDAETETDVETEPDAAIEVVEDTDIVSATDSDIPYLGLGMVEIFKEEYTPNEYGYYTMKITGFGSYWDQGYEKYYQFAHNNIVRQVSGANFTSTSTVGVEMAYQVAYLDDNGDVCYKSVTMDQLRVYKADDAGNMVEMQNFTGASLYARDLVYYQLQNDGTYVPLEETYCAYVLGMRMFDKYEVVYDPDHDGKYLDDDNYRLTIEFRPAETAFYSTDTVCKSGFYDNEARFIITEDTRTFYAISATGNWNLAAEPFVMYWWNYNTGYMGPYQYQEGESLSDYYDIEPYRYTTLADGSQKVVAYKITVKESAEYHVLVIMAADGSELRRITPSDYLVNTIYGSKASDVALYHKSYYGGADVCYVGGDTYNAQTGWKYYLAGEEEGYYETDLSYLGYTEYSSEHNGYVFVPYVYEYYEDPNEDFLILRKNEFYLEEDINYINCIEDETNGKYIVYTEAGNDCVLLESSKGDGYACRLTIYEPSEYVIIRKDSSNSYLSHRAVDGSYDINGMDAIVIKPNNAKAVSLGEQAVYSYSSVDRTLSDRIYVNLDSSGQVASYGQVKAVTYKVKDLETGIWHDASDNYGDLIAVETGDGNIDAIATIVSTSSQAKIVSVRVSCITGPVEEYRNSWTEEYTVLFGSVASHVYATSQIYYNEAEHSAEINVINGRLEQSQSMVYLLGDNDFVFIGLMQGKKSGYNLLEAQSIDTSKIQVLDEEGNDITSAKMRFWGEKVYRAGDNEIPIAIISINDIEPDKKYHVRYPVGEDAEQICINVTRDYVIIGSEEFPDNYFRNYVYEYFDTDRNGILDAIELNAVTAIEFTEYGKVYSLEGIQHFKNLEYLYAFRQNLTELDLSENTELTTLNIQGNSITKIDLSKNTKLCNYNEKYRDRESNGYTGLNDQGISRTAINGSIEDDKYTAITISFPIHQIYDMNGADLYPSTDWINGRNLLIYAPGSLLDDSAEIVTEVWGSYSYSSRGDYVYMGRCFDQKDIYYPNISLYNDEGYAYFYAYVMYVIEGEYTREEVNELLLDSFSDEYYFELGYSPYTVYEQMLQYYVPDDGSQRSMNSLRNSTYVDSAVFQYYDVDFRQFVGADDDRVVGYYEENTQGNVELNGQAARFLPITDYVDQFTGVHIASSSLKTAYLYNYNNSNIFPWDDGLDFECLCVDVSFNYVVDAKDMSELPEELSEEYSSIADFENSIAGQSGNSEYSCESVCTLDADLWKYATEWQTVDAENFPSEGVEVFIPYGDGISADSDVVIAHVFTHDMNGYKAGDIEYPEVYHVDGGIKFVVHGFSPIVVMNKVEVDNSIVNGVNAALADNIKMNFYLDAAVLDEVTQIEVDGPSGKITFAKADVNYDAGSAYVTYDVAVKDLNKTITVKGKNGDDVVGKSYSMNVNSYLSKVIANGDYNPNTDDTYLISLASALKQYGEVAKKYFENPSQTVYGVDDADLDDFAAQISGTIPSGVEYVGASLVLESNTYIRFYFVGSVDECSFKLGDTYVEPESLGGGIYTVTTAGINATGLGDAVELTVDNGRCDWSLNYSALSYCYCAQDSDGVLGSLADAMYWYYEAAVEYARYANVY